jgi:DNA-binding PadR family transcriptional regulator
MMHGGGGRHGPWGGPGPWAPWLGWMMGAAQTRGHRGAPFGPWAFGPGPRGGGFAKHPFGRPPRARRGDVRAAALALLAEQPMNGYQIIEEIARRSSGMWRPSSGSVYPALQQLEDEGLIRAEQSEGRRVFTITDAGRAYVDEHPDELAAPWETVGDAVPEEMVELGQLASQVGMAFMQVVQVGSPAQLAQAKQVLSDTRRALYRILAEGDSGGLDDETDIDEADDAAGGYGPGES